MFRLTREVRFAVNQSSAPPTAMTAANSFAGVPSIAGMGQYLAMQVTLEGALDGDSQYLRNIKEIDEVAREQAVEVVWRAVQEQTPPARVVAALMNKLKNAWPGAALVEIRLMLSPFLWAGCLASEYPMVRLSEKFEFSAAHRLHNPALSDEANRMTFGKCNNAFGHGHNYELAVTLVGEPDANGLLIQPTLFEQTVAQAVIERLDHKNLNVEVPEFRDVIPSVENIARVIFKLLKGKFGNAKLASVTVWETGKTWCEYDELPGAS